MGRFILTDGVLPLVADRFKALSEPARLALLRSLQYGEQTVNQLVAGTGLGQANVSKHLQVLHAHGFVKRRKNGLFVHYALADRQILKLCELMSSRVNAHVTAGGQSHARGPVGHIDNSDEVG
ncbi:ArsR/SmtB family transcription factor [Gemmatimonas groenlandica]|uniref:Winged helix-turn-helix transcriptional regulator n=1 Tax=Gemmatimonas groenlandica TaxID=2732249 RepID=A0A6M4IPM1_9BACT|nr:metalloregulator ArsR/SmtB family transcription factor [Gemmatimonas groenlandica]QJR36874.1 winged helix-turn-helix transcriptional regulator [Gemmatimonas groenlandica]